ncbi:tRNA (adenosine(37)-N6)-dimethylallyltransferase MiaA [Geoalkalibacter halelectricus]|uniref:tRNA dimethylallyltransferase n=1 Tax=Geoalkalibacter halelectricus TaxID=2847045 RepID=A0ABY5ZFN1_9BACT|nr:tRNA (adenosine(37)-N6)-dimethylallyltransferase MiaA [Geoalkalibacter halelectricus]MDO3377908.1 tRNA (adenosine(37)-N6)-dimethylallyltransferase MiaA [Geoalkalibacter halelectricus]UWZ77911.1 tRNA (adenosine(37)-N6)-dimethylallyltransferase MiaA [Geoalkalibacter halelectricus]
MVARKDLSFNLLVVLGPTASGKTRLGVELARRLNGEIISADSRQVFRGMDLGTGKDLAEYGDIPHHLIDIAAAGEEFSVFAFQRAFYDAFAAIGQRGRLPLLVGGTGLYLDAVLRGYRLVEVPPDPALRTRLAILDDAALRERLRRLKPDLHNTTDLQDRERLIRAIEIASGEQAAALEQPPLPRLTPLVLGVRWERAELRRRIAQRLHARLDQGLVEEVAHLHAAGVPWARLEFYGLEYRFIAQHLQGALTYDAMVRQLTIAIGQFAKRQETFFRRMERQGLGIHWLDGRTDALAQALAIVHEATPGGLG